MALKQYVKMEATVVHTSGPLYAGQTYELPSDVAQGLIAGNCAKRAAPPSNKEVQPADK